MLQNWLMLQAQFLQPITLAHCFTLSGLSLVFFMHAGKPPLPANYLTDGFLQLQVHLLGSSHYFCCFCVFTALLYSITPTCPRYISYIVYSSALCGRVVWEPTRPLVMRTMIKISTHESKIPMTFGSWYCATHMWIPWQWAEQTCHRKLQIYKPRITWEAKKDQELRHRSGLEEKPRKAGSWRKSFSPLRVIGTLSFSFTLPSILLQR